MYQNQNQASTKPKVPDIAVGYKKTSQSGLNYVGIIVDLDELFKLEEVKQYLQTGPGHGAKLNLTMFDRIDAKTKATQPDFFVKKRSKYAAAGKSSQGQIVRGTNAQSASTGNFPWSQD